MAGGWFRPITPSRDEPAKLDTGVAHIARMQNYRRGGKDNSAADRVAAEHAMAAYPGLVSSVRLTRHSWPGRCGR
jgi:S-adenosyl methyltransferase